MQVGLTIKIDAGHDARLGQELGERLAECGLELEHGRPLDRDGGRREHDAVKRVLLGENRVQSDERAVRHARENERRLRQRRSAAGIMMPAQHFGEDFPLGKRQKCIGIVDKAVKFAAMGSHLVFVSVARAVAHHVVRDHTILVLAEPLKQTRVPLRMVTDAVQVEHDAAHFGWVVVVVPGWKQSAVKELLATRSLEFAAQVLQGIAVFVVRFIVLHLSIALFSFARCVLSFEDPLDA